MINRLILATATAAAVVVVVTPAAIGLRGTSSFTQNIPVPVPEDAHRIRSDDPVLVRDPVRPTPSHVIRPSRSASVSPSPEIERHGGRTSGSDDGSHRSGGATTTGSDDRSRGVADDRTSSAVPDDRTSAAVPDDRTGSRGSGGSGSGGRGSGGGGSDDGSGGGSHSGGHG